MIWIFEQWTELERGICDACLNNEYSNHIIILHDDGFLPVGVMSPYRFYIEKDLFIQKAENPLFADLLEVPNLWEIRMYYDRAEIWDEGIKKAKITYAEPINRHNVKNVQWVMSDSLVYKKDYYDKYGKLYYTDLVDQDGHTDVRTYYAEEKPVIIYQPGFDTYTLLQEGKVYNLYYSTKLFLTQILFRHFPQDNYIISNSIKILEMMSDVGRPPCNFSNDAFLLTSSDQIEHLEELIYALPMIQFHIAAKTRMSNKLLYLEKYSNVTLYQGISEQKKIELLIKSTYYLDINHYQEVCDAVYEAYRYNLLIVGFDNTLHNSSCVLQECIFKSEDADGMILFLKTMYMDHDALSGAVTRQNKCLEEKDRKRIVYGYENI